MKMNTQPVIPWMGSKRRIVDWIASRMPIHQCYVEAFAGSAALFFGKLPFQCPPFFFSFG